MIAHDLGRIFYPEEYIRVWEQWRMGYMMKRDNFVLQAPALCRYIDKYTEQDVAIVLMRRPIADIVASEQRINWEGQPRELAQYGLKEGVISEVKYRYWDERQRELIDNPFEIEYSSLKSHPMWIPETERGNFGPRQYSHEADCS